MGNGYVLGEFVHLHDMLSLYGLLVSAGLCVGMCRLKEKSLNNVNLSKIAIPQTHDCYRKLNVLQKPKDGLESMAIVVRTSNLEG